MQQILKKAALLITSLALTFCFSTQKAQADTLINIGVGVGYATSPYIDHDPILFPYPAMHIEAKHVYVRGLSAGVFLWTDDNELNELSIGLNINTQHFDNNSTNDARLALLDDRDMSLDAYIQYILRSKIGHIGVRLSHDTLDNADGFLFHAYYKIPIPLGQVTLTPGLGFHFLTEERTEYYYGISHAESVRSGLSYYSPDSAFTPYASLEASVKVNDLVNVFVGGSMNFLSSEIKDSPMVDKDYIYAFTCGVTYSF